MNTIDKHANRRSAAIPRGAGKLGKYIIAGILTALLLAVFLTGQLQTPQPAEAQNATVFVKNTGQSTTTTGQSLDATTPKFGQSFTTGPSKAGYTLASIGVNFNQIDPSSSPNSEISATLNANNNGTPGTELCTLTNPSGLRNLDLNTFVAPTTDPCPTLTVNTQYFVVIIRANYNTYPIKVGSIASDDEDSGAAPGWSIGNQDRHYQSGSWQAASGNRSLVIQVTGTTVSTVLIKNTGQTPIPVGNPLTSTIIKYAQQFTAGTSAGGYALSSIAIDFDDISDPSAAIPQLIVTLNANNNGNPGDVLCTLTNPASFTSEAVHVFNAPTTGCPTIAASIAYFVVIERVNSTSHAIRLDFTTSTDEDSAGAAGWSIFNGSQKLQSGQSWVKDTLSTYMIEVSGYAEELPGEVPVDWALKPSGLEAGDRFRLIFLSSTERNAESTAIADYNSFVKNLAAAGHADIQPYSSQFRAVACTSAVNAIKNTGTFGTGVPIYWLNGAKAADNYADFYDGSWDEEVTVRTESGTAVAIPNTVAAYDVWVGCEKDGTKGKSTANNSIVLGTSQPGLGRLNSVATASGPLDDNSAKDPKAALNYVYGLSPIFVVKPPSPKIPNNWALKPSGLEGGDSFRLIFLSSTERTAESTDINNYNNSVQDMAAAGHTDIQQYQSGFRAVACTSAVNAIKNTGTFGTGVPIYWLNGAKAADNYADFYDGSWDEEVTVRTESGTAVTIPNTVSAYDVWVGCEKDGTKGKSTANNSIVLGTSQPGLGRLNSVATASGPLDDNSAKDPKAALNYVYGLSQLFTIMEETTVPIVQGPVLVKNTAQTASTQVWALNDNAPRRAQAFTTGPDASYSLASIGFRFDDIADTSAAGDELAVKLTSNNRGSPGTTLCTLTDPSTFSSNALNTFDAPATCPTLARNTTYFALIERTTVTTNIVLKATGSNNEDSGAAAGWSISNGRIYFQGGSWRDFSTQSHQIVVSGTSDGPPPLTVNFEHENYSVAEGDSIGINVTLSTAPDQQVTITVGRSSPNGATTGDYSYAPGQLTFNSGETNQTITFTANVDTAVDDGEQVVFTIIGTPTGVITGLRNQATVTIVDTQDPEVTVSFDQAAYSVTEGNTVTVRVNLSEDPDRNVTIPLTKVNQNGATADDYSGVPSTVTFSDGTTQRSFTFRAATDADHENNESVLIGFSTLPAKVTAGPTNQTTVDITEAPPVNRPPEVSATASTASVYSGEAVTLDGNAADPDDDALTYRWTSDVGGIFDPGPSILDTAWIAPAIGTAYTAALTLTVTDEHGLSSSITIVVVVQPPPAPNPATGLDGHVSDHNVVSLTWTIPNQPSLITLDNVLVQQRMSGGQFSAPVWETIATLPPSTTAHTFNGLDGNTTFRFRIRLTSTISTYADSAHVDVRTLKTAPAPRHFDTVSPTQTSITLSWFTLETAAEYKLEYRKDGDTDWTRIPGTFDHLPSSTDHRDAFAIAAGLDCEARYEFRLSARGSGNTRHDGNRYPSTTFGSYAYTSGQTGECAQGERITNLLVSIEPRCATLTWTPPSGDRDDGYRVERYSYSDNRAHRTSTEILIDQPNRITDRYEDCSPSYTTEGLEHVYIVSAWDNNPGPDEQHVFGSAYYRILPYGPISEPQAPLNVRLTRDTQTSRQVQWNAPLDLWLSTIKTARASTGQQQVVTDPWTSGYRVERREYQRFEDGSWALPDVSETSVLSATMTAGTSSQNTKSGYNSSLSDPHGTLTSTTFTHKQGTYTIVALFLQTTGANRLAMVITPVPPGSRFDNLALVIGRDTFQFAKATQANIASILQLHWPSQGLTLADGESVTIKILALEDLQWDKLRDETEGDTSRSFTDSTDKGDKQYVYRIWPYNAKGLSHHSHRGDWVFNGGDPGGNPVGGLQEPEPILPPERPQQGADTPSNTPATGQPTISGTPQVRQTLTADTSGISDAEGLTNVSYEYQWLAGGAGISGAASSSLLLTHSELGQTIQVKVTFTDDAGNQESLTSVATETVAAKPNTTATGEPTISGTPQVDETLTADTSAISDQDGLANVSYQYQWLRDDAEIEGQTGPTYELVSADEGKTIKVRVAFNDDAGNAESLTSTATTPVAAQPAETPVALITASFANVPADHNGENFTFQLTFSENVNAGYARIQDHAFTVDGGAIANAYRQTQGSNQGWHVEVDPTGNEAVTITLPETTDCDAARAICTDDERMLSHATSEIVAGPPAISVSDATVQEAEGAVLEFSVTLSHASSRTVTVDYATSDGSAQAGSDYTATSGAITFNIGQTSQTVQVAVLTDSDEEGQETLTLTLSNPGQATLADATGAGAILNGESTAPQEDPVVLVTATFSNMPATHNGTSFTFELDFSENVKAGYARIRDHAFTIHGGKINSAVRKEQGTNQYWTITVKPDGNASVYITLPETTDCDADAAICTYDKRKLSHTNVATINGPG